jgi:hypothetical protein
VIIVVATIEIAVNAPIKGEREMFGDEVVTGVILHIKHVDVAVGCAVYMRN